MLIYLTMIIYFFFSLIFLMIFALCIFVSLLLKCLVVYHVSLCELYLLLLKILIFVSFKIKKNLISILIAIVCGQWLDSIWRDSLAGFDVAAYPLGLSQMARKWDLLGTEALSLRDFEELKIC